MQNTGIYEAGEVGQRKEKVSGVFYTNNNPVKGRKKKHSKGQCGLNRQKNRVNRKKKPG